MKIATINTHSLVEERYQEKLIQCIAYLAKEQPDVIAMQEVNQSMNASVIEAPLLFQSCPESSTPIRADNHAYQVVLRMQQLGISYHWTWCAGKIGYGKYDEGMAILCKNRPMEACTSFYISRSREYTNWKSRAALGVKWEGAWYYTVHMGWWNDVDEPFQLHWDSLKKELVRREEITWLLGDFNNPAELPAQGYDMIRSDGWYDTYLLAKTKDNGITVQEAIDGWRNQLENPALCGNGMRIDQIWCSRKLEVQTSSVIFDGVNGEKISDHFGVMIVL